MAGKRQNKVTGADSGHSLDTRIERLPRLPGVYVMKDAGGKVIYVGKAKSLRERVRSYLHATDTRPSVKFIMSRAVDLEYILTDNEKEALLLENTLIKQHAPRYNVRLKDDKSYVCIRVDVQTDFPRVTIGRRFRKDGALYFGPYASAKEVRKTVRLAHDVFPLRTCSTAVFRSRTRPCIQYEIHRCPGPCCGLISRDAYRRIVDDLVLFLRGRNDELVRRFRQQMKEAADSLDFEEAARLRDRIKAIEATLERQKVARAVAGDDRDVIGLHREGGTLAIVVLAYRAGQLTSTDSYFFPRTRQPIEEAVSSFLTQYYGSGRRFVPAEVLVPVAVEASDSLEEYLAELRGKRVTVRRPQRGEKVQLLNMAARNAEAALEQRRRREEDVANVLEKLRDRLGLASVPHRIECFDISNIGGTQAVGSMVTFADGVPDKSRYKRYRIKTVRGADDYAMMREVLIRRYQRAVAEDDLPDLVVVDGGLGQLNVARTVLEDLAIGDVDVIGLAKGRGRAVAAARRGRSRQVDEHVFVPGRKNPIQLAPHGAAMHLLERIRDEAHRFAITYHRRLRKKETVRSELDAIPGIGPRRLEMLLAHFGSVARIRSASVAEIAALPGIPRSVAERVHTALH